MPEFDPYLKWLGIRDPERPVNFYRLLGLDLFESDPDIISMAADRQMSHVRSYQNGPNGDASQTLLNELARARRCLLTPDQKKEYDQQLRHSSRESTAEVVPVVVSSPVKTSRTADKKNIRQPAAGVDQVQVGSSASLKGLRTKRDRNNLVFSLIGWITGGLAALGVGAWLVGSGFLDSGQSANKDLTNSGTSISDPGMSTKGTTGTSTNEKPKNERATRPQPDVATPPRNNKDRPPTRTPLKEVTRYPRLSGTAENLWQAARELLASKKIYEFELSNRSGGDRIFRELPWEVGILIGMAIETDGDNRIETIAPIYVNQRHAFQGRTIGAQLKSPTVLLARPGYAVGEIHVSRVAPMNCIKLTYMKMGAGALDVSNRYQSSQVGEDTGFVDSIPNPQGLPIVGIRGRYKSDGSVMALGLIGAGSASPMNPANASPKVTDVIRSVRPGSEDPPSFFPNGKTPDRPDPGMNNKDPFAADPEAIAELPKKRKVPGQKQIRTIQKTVRELYAERFKNAKDVRAIRSFGQLMFNDAIGSEDEDTKFVMLNETVAIAESIGDLKLAVESLREMDSQYEVEYWNLVKASVDDSAANTHKLTVLDFRRTLDGLIQETIDNEYFEEAVWLVGRALTIAKRAGDASAIESYLTKRKQVQAFEKLWVSNTKAMKTLANTPDDPGANQNRGDYLFVVDDDLESALNHWKNSNDSSFKKLPNLESNLDRNDMESLHEIAEAWLAAGKGARTIRDQKCLERAVDFFEDVEARLEGVERRKMEQKIELIRQDIQ